MPSPRSVGAPRFEGKEVTAFLLSVAQHGANAGITDMDDLVPYIVQYSSSDVRDLIRYMPEFDPEVTKKTWTAAKAQLMLLYGHSERVPDYTESMLKDYCEKQSAKSPFTNMVDIESYYRGFAQIAVPLIKKARITAKERDFYFIAGIPEVIKEWFLSQVPEAKRKRSDPPTIAESIGYLQKRFDDDSLTFKPWAEETQASAVQAKSSSSTSMFGQNTLHAPLPSQVPLASDAMDDLTKQIQNLNLNLAKFSVPQAAPQAPPNQYSENEQRRCFMCAKQDTTPTHLGFVGGVAEYIRALSRDRAAANQNQTARTSAMALSYGSTSILAGDNFAVSSLDFMNRNADPVTRTGKDSSPRFDPTKRPDTKGKAREIPPHMGQGPAAKPAPGPSKPADTSLPSPPSNPINRQDGWKDSRPSNPKTRDEDVVMRDAKKFNLGDKYHITSDIQERTDAKAVFETLLKTEVSIPLLQLVGLSPQLQKLFTDSTRSKREYANKSAEYSVRFAEPDTEIHMERAEIVDSGPKHVYADATYDEIRHFLVNYGSAIAKVPEGRYFAMSTGSLSIQIGDTELTAMIDTGSELNLASKLVPSRCNLAVDFEGMKWALKGIHGGPEQLRGCATDELGPHDLILGQPFLQWFAARLDYERSGAVSMYLWKTGDRKIHPTIVVTITDPKDPRNATSINRSHRATIEEVPDEDDYPTEDF
ncbi:hypothetical protein DFH07DRAFT_964105 [Mycena maculata]|uniref:DUF4100 domain-containing protein n=1 Tax=Mycena maculata TaxID=230809 RepID=A0AAD7IJU4_9AGAR|nr:hypothetical protein DFH07DRAFT_964105 [Mycena maculata]